MDTNSAYRERPKLLRVAVLIVAAVGVWYMIQAILTLRTDIPVSIFEEVEGLDLDWEGLADLTKTLVAVVYVIFGILSFLLASLLHKGSAGGRIFMIIILVLSILLNAIGLIILNPYSIVTLLLAIAVLVILLRPDVKAYFER
jgi:hypothetical protein